MLNLRVEFGPCDPMNPGFGYQLRVDGPDGLVFFGSKHPATGEDLTYGSCLDVAATYHAKWVAQCLATSVVDCPVCEKGQVQVGEADAFRDCTRCGGRGRVLASSLGAFHRYEDAVTYRPDTSSASDWRLIAEALTEEAAGIESSLTDAQRQASVRLSEVTALRDAAEDCERRARLLLTPAREALVPHTALYRHQLAALQRFATAHGRYWKRDLRQAWETGQYHGNHDDSILQGIRNTLGPSWLIKFRLPASEVQS